MKINKELFDKLPQLDRIEFRQRKSEIDNKYSGTSTTLLYIYTLLGYFVFVIICNTFLTISGHDNFISPSLWIFIILPIGLILDVISAIYYAKETKVLINEYFKVEVKKKK